MRIVIALGGNALLGRGESPDADSQRARIAQVAGPLAELARDHEVAVVHGNGPQVGLLALETSTDRALTRPYPLSDLVAETQGLIGYWLQQAILRHLETPVVSLITQTVVDSLDPAFHTPTKFVGSSYNVVDAEDLTKLHGWTFRRDGHEWRRVVASPVPRRVVEIETAAALLDQGVTVVLGGGGGVPVVEDSSGLRGVDAVIDKDFVAAHIAEVLKADLLLVLTDVAAVMADFETPHERPLDKVTVKELDALLFASGSMGPKVRAVSQFVTSQGKPAAIGSVDDVLAVFSGTAGTHVNS